MARPEEQADPEGQHPDRRSGPLYIVFVRVAHGVDFGSDAAEVPLRASEFTGVRSEEGEVMDRWKSPIDIEFFTQEFSMKILDDETGAVVKACMDMGINIDKDELLKALRYDRRQYEKGYFDGIRARDDEIVRCKDCVHRPKGTNKHDLEFPDYVCPCQCDDFWYSWMPKDDWFCANGERRDDAEVH